MTSLKVLPFIFGVMLVPVAYASYTVQTSFAEVSCPNCIHWAMKTSNVPPTLEKIFNSTLKKLDPLGLSDPNCLTAASKTDVCPKTELPGFIVNKCEFTTVTLHAKSLLTYQSDAEMEITLTERSCSPRWRDDTDRCERYSELIPEVQERVTEKLKNIASKFMYTHYTGEICLKSPTM